MRHPKALHVSSTGNGRSQNEDFALTNLEQGIHILCDGGGKPEKGRLASEYVAKKLQDRLVEANHQQQLRPIELSAPKRLQGMQEAMLSAFEEIQAGFMKIGTQSASLEGAHVSCIAVWLQDSFAILAHLGNCRAYLFRSGKIYTLTRDHVSEGGAAGGMVRAFGPQFTAPDLLKIEFEPGDLLFLMSDGAYGSLRSDGTVKLVQSMLIGREVKGILDQCAYASGDDSTLVQIQFPKEGVQGPISASTRVELVSKTPLCKYMDFTQRSHIAALCQVEEFEAQTILVQEDTDGDCMYLVAKGTLEILMKGQFIAYKKQGEFLGEVSLIRMGKRTATAVAKDRVTLLTLQRSDLMEAFKRDVELERNFYRGMLEMVLDRMTEQGREIARMKSV
jgi:serine/threonine protein phosphatase PrpC/CRP-like cAMP-binding protein